MKSMMSLFLVAMVFVAAQSTYVPSVFDAQEEELPMADVEQETRSAAFETYVPDTGVTEKEDEYVEMKNALMAGINNFELTASRQPFMYTCPPGAALSYMYSQHQNSVEDRHWRFGCRKISTMYIDEQCTWSPNHAFDQPLQGMCAPGFVVTGFRSLKYSVPHRDRQYSVQCCKSDAVETCCTTSDYINNWDAVMDFTAPANKIISGIYSVHNNGKEDRRFKVKTCDLKKSFYDCTC